MSKKHRLLTAALRASRCTSKCSKANVKQRLLVAMQEFVSRQINTADVHNPLKDPSSISEDEACGIK